MPTSSSGRQASQAHRKWKVANMARALVGYVGTSNEHVLAYEVTRLRRRVAELEAQLAELRTEHAGDLDLRDLELHNFTGSAEPVLA